MTTTEVLAVRAADWAARVASVDARVERIMANIARSVEEGRYESASDWERANAARSLANAEARQATMHAEAAAWFARHGLDPADYEMEL